MNEFIPLVKKYAARYQLDFAVVCAVVEQESQWQPWSVRDEPEFFNHYVMPLLKAGKFTISEAQCRTMSWGLLQCMGQTAREAGYSGPLPQLCDPEVGLDWGCKILANKIKSAARLEDGLARWNGGGNVNYAAEVVARIPKYKTL